MAAKWKQGTARTGTAIVGRRSRPGQVVTAQQWIKCSDIRIVETVIFLQSKAAALRWIIGSGRTTAKPCRITVGIQAGRVERWIDDSEIEMFGQKRLLIRYSELNVINALHVGEIGAEPGVGQRPIL